MGNCTKCNALIDDNETLCDSCKTAGDDSQNFDEMYLDNLLNSLMSGDEQSQDVEDEINGIISADENHNMDENDNLDDIVSMDENDNLDDIISIDENNDLDNSISSDAVLDLETAVSNEDNSEFDDLQNILDNLDNNQLDEYHDNNDSSVDVDKVSSQVEESDNIELEQSQEDKELLELLNMFSTESEDSNHVSSDNSNDLELGNLDDVLSLDDFSNDNEVKSNHKPVSEVSDVLADAISAVSSLDDPEDELLQSIPNVKEKPKKMSLFQKLFANVKDETKAVSKQPMAGNSNEGSVESGEEGKADVPVKKGKKKKGKNGSDTENEDGKESTANNNKLSKKEKKDQKSLLQAEKKLKKEEKKKDKLAESVAEVLEDEGRINKVGATIVFLFVTILAVVVIVGTNIFSYNLNIKSANKYFGKQKYDQAYDAIKGIEIKNADKTLSDKIETVMFVKKELNSYENYCGIKLYPEALDSLLKGIEKYDKYIEQAKELGVEADMENIKAQIVELLNSKYGISLEDAYSIISITSQEQYSQVVVNAAAGYK